MRTNMFLTQLTVCNSLTQITNEKKNFFPQGEHMFCVFPLT